MHSCAVIVPLYQARLSSAEQLSLENTIEVLSEYPIYLVGPKSLEPYLEQLRQQFHDRLIRITFANRFFVSVDGYNQLMLSKSFYQAFSQFEYMLIVQTDALVLSNELQLWCTKQYSYIGAPWFDGFTQPTLPLTLKSAGNGGFSLRRIPDFLQVLSRPRVFKNTLMQTWPGNWLSTVYRYVKDYHSFVYNDFHLNLNVNEDLFWALFVPAACPFFTVPSAQDAVPFSFEAYPEHLYQLNHQILPFGCHAWQRYQPTFWQQVTAEKGVQLAERLQLVLDQE